MDKKGNTYQDNLTEKEIKDLLRDYEPVREIGDIPINTHLRYFATNKEGKRQFRLGGYLSKIDLKKGYLVLTNGKVNWSVQLKDAIFFRKLSVEDIRDYYEEKIKKYKSEIRELKDSLKQIKKQLGRKD